MSIAASVISFVAFQKKHEADAERDHARNALAQVFAERSWSALSIGNRDLAIRYAVSGWRVAPSNASHFRAPLANALASTVIPVMHKFDQGRIDILATSPDGKYVITAAEGFAVLVDMASLNPIGSPFPHKGKITAAMPDPTGTRVLTITDDAIIHIWNVKTHREVRLTAHTAPITAASFSLDGRRLLSASIDETSKLWDLSTGELVQTLIGHTDTVSAAAFSPDNRLLVTGSKDGMVRIWSAENGVALWALTKHTGKVTSIAFSPDGRFLLTGSADRTGLAWHIPIQQTDPQPLAGHEAGIEATSVSSDASKAYVIDLNGNAYIGTSAPHALL